MLFLNGAGGGIRTPDLLITNQLLYQLSYASTINLIISCQKECQKNMLLATTNMIIFPEPIRQTILYC